MARIQMDIYQKISSLPGYEEALVDLNSRLLDINELYHKFAVPLQLHELILRVIHTANTGAQGRPFVESAWEAILKQGKFFFLFFLFFSFFFFFFSSFLYNKLLF